MFIEINGVPYVVRQGSDLEWAYAQVLTTPFRTSGVPTPTDNQVVSRFKMDWQKGVGYARQLRAEDVGVGGLRDASVATYFRSRITLPLLQQDPTEPNDQSEMAVSQFSFEFKGNYWMLGQDDDTNDTSTIIQWDGATTDWGVGSNELTATTSVPSEVVVVSDTVVVLIHNATSHVMRIDAAATLDSWAFAGTPPTASMLTTSAGTRTFEQSKIGKMVVVDGVIYAGLWHEDISTMTMFTSADKGAVWVDRAVDVQSTLGVTGRCAYVDLNGDPAPLFATRDAIYAYDISATVWQEFFRFPVADDNNGRGMVAARGFVWCGGGDGALWKIWVEASVGSLGSVNAVNVGPTRNALDGLIAERQGYVTCHEMNVSSEFLDFAYGGHDASHKASIMRLRFDDDSLHFFHRHGTANQKIRWLNSSQEDDDVVRMHFSVEEDSSNTDEQFIVAPFENPLGGGTISYAATGLADFAEDDMSDELTAAGVFQAVISVDGLTAGTAGEYIDYSTGSDSADWGTNDREDFNADTKALQFANGEGISVNTLKNRLVLNRDGGDVTQTPKIKRFEVQAVNLQATLRQTTIPIDLDKTFKEFGREVETQIEEIEAVAKLATQQLVSIGKFADFRATITIPPSVSMTLKAGNEQQEEGVVGGVMVIRVNQLLEGV